MVKGFPDTPGIYIAQRSSQVVLIKITGYYPNLVLGKSIDITGWIAGGGIKEASRDLLANLVYNANEWDFQLIPKINMSVFPKTAFRPDGIVDIDPDTRSSIRTKYFRLSQQGVPYGDIMRTLVYEYNITMDQTRQLVNEFDKEGYAD